MKRVSGTDLDNEAVQKRLKALTQGGKIPVTAVAVKSGKGVIIDCIILTVNRSPKPNATGYAALTVLVLGAKDTVPGSTAPLSDVIQVPNQRSTVETFMSGSKAQPLRSPITITAGSLFSGTSFNAGASPLLQPMTRGLLNGVSYQVGYTDTDVEDSDMHAGDAFIEFRVDNVNDIRPVTNKEFLELTSACRALPVDQLMFGKRLAYPVDIHRENVVFPPNNTRKVEEVKYGMMVPWAIDNEVLLSHSRNQPSTLLHVCNHVHAFLDDFQNLPDEYVSGGPPIVIAPVPNSAELQTQAKGGETIPCIVDPENFKGFRMTTADPTTAQGDFFAQFRVQHVQALGITHLDTWMKFAQWLVCCMDMIVLFKANVKDSNCIPVEGAEESFLQRGLMNVVMIMVDNMFGWAGVKVSFATMKEAMLRNGYGNQWEDKKIINKSLTDTSAKSSELTSGNGHDVKVICLNEFKGDVNVFNGEDGMLWRFYCVPPSLYFTEVKNVKDSLLQYNFKGVNVQDKGDDYFRAQFMEDTKTRNQLGYFAVRD
jgi:hypothetical protein